MNDMDECLTAADHISDARRCPDPIELAVRQDPPSGRCSDRSAIAHVAYLAISSLDKAEARLGAAA